MTLLHFRGRTKVHFAGPRTKGPGQVLNRRLPYNYRRTCCPAVLDYWPVAAFLASQSRIQLL